MVDFDGRVQFRVDSPELAAWIGDRTARMHTGSVHQQAREEIGLLRSLLDIELRRIRLTLGEASCIADVCNSWLLDMTAAVRPGLVYAECYDAFRLAREDGGDMSSYGQKWEVDEPVLLEKLGGIGPCADHALRDAVSRWWERGLDATVEGFAAVGLRVIETPARTGAQ